MITLTTHQNPISEFAHSMLRGFGWRAGGRLANTLPIALIVILGIGVLVYFGYQYFKKSK